MLTLKMKVSCYIGFQNIKKYHVTQASEINKSIMFPAVGFRS